MPVCTRCGTEIGFFGTVVDGKCIKCLEAIERGAPETLEDKQVIDERLARIILTTEASHNLPVAERVGVLTSEYVVGINIFRDIAAAFRDAFGGRSETMQRGLREAKEAALEDLRAQAVDLGAEAVVAIDLDYSEISGGGKSMLFLVASGTAVKLEKA
ncbi:hypothetical protein CKO11_16585 [Rhodobacter sp. TJ_12]|uniref:YbjQ family protein n=1 Tax=Rhodobacter sp. TJ_12 TaxID=2029399 RepID=UPI001CBFF6D9|nr:YbjQ family protein [Rhodobacter sp. TJ_12]MBZ4024067.1 hypothetical protein [Rhodobacter sp. TJ_12]